MDGEPVLAREFLRILEVLSRLELYWQDVWVREWMLEGIEWLLWLGSYVAVPLN